MELHRAGCATTAFGLMFSVFVLLVMAPCVSGINSMRGLVTGLQVDEGVLSARESLLPKHLAKVDEEATDPNEDRSTVSFMEDSVTVTKNQSSRVHPRRLANQTLDAPGYAASVHLLSDLEKSKFVEAIRLKSEGFLEEVREIQRKSANSAGAMAELASTSANSTGSFVEKVAMQSAVLVAQMQELERLSAHDMRRAGPSHAFPHMHIVGYRDRGFAKRHAQSPLVKAEAAVGSMRVFQTVFASSALVGSLLLWLNRSQGRQKLLEYKYNRCEEVSCQLDTKALSVWDGTVSVFSCIVGTGILAMPYAFSLAGLIAVPVVLFFVCCSAYTAHLMAWALQSKAFDAERRDIKPAMRGWGFLAESAFGRRAKVAMDSFLIVELWGYMLSSIVCTAMNVTQIAEDMNVTAAVFMCVTTAYALTFVPVRILTQVNVVSNVVFIACCLMFVITGFLLPERAPASEIQYVKPHGLLSAAGILVFSPAGHSFYPALMQRMEEPRKFPVCVRRAYVLAAILYVLVAVPGYVFFGNATQPSAVRNIGADLHLIPIPDLGWMNTVAAVGMVVKMLALQSLVLSPLASTVEGVLGGDNLEPVLKAAVAPCILVVSAAVAIHFASEMAMLLNLIGSVFCMNIAFVVPVVCYWKVAPEPVGPLKKALFVSLIVIGGTFAVLGVLTSL